MSGGAVRRRWATLAVLALLTVPGALAVGAPASAHARLTASDPKADATVTRPLSRVTLTFSELVRGNLSTVVITGPGGSRHGAGKPQAVDKQVRQPVTTLPSGEYRVAYRVVSVDGHPIEGQFRFTVALPPGQEPTTAPPTPTVPPTVAATATPPATASVVPVASPDPGSGTGTWWAAGIAGVGVLGAGAVALLLRRRRTTTNG